MILSYICRILRQVGVTHWLERQVSTAGTAAVKLQKYFLTKHTLRPTVWQSPVCPYCTDREATSTTKMTNAHGQCFSVNNQLLLPNLKTFAQFTHSLHATPNASCFQSVSSSRTVCRCHQSLYSGVSHSQHPRTTSHTPAPLSRSYPIFPISSPVR